MAPKRSEALEAEIRRLADAGRDLHAYGLHVRLAERFGFSPTRVGQLVRREELRREPWRRPQP